MSLLYSIAIAGAAFITGRFCMQLYLSSKNWDAEREALQREVERKREKESAQLKSKSRR